MFGFWAHASRKLRQGPPTQVSSWSGINPDYRCGFSCSIEQVFCSIPGRARASSCVAGDRYSSIIPISRSCARSCAKLRAQTSIQFEIKLGQTLFVSTVSGPLGPSSDLIDALGPSPDLLDALAARIESPEALIAWTMVLVVVTVVRTAWRAALKLALCTVLAFCGKYVLGYVLPILRFFSQIPW